jgi:phospholipase C
MDDPVSAPVAHPSHLSHAAAVGAARAAVLGDAVTRSFLRAVDTNISYISSATSDALDRLAKHGGVWETAAEHLRSLSGIEPTVISRQSHMGRPKRWRVLPITVAATVAAPLSIGLGRLSEFLMHSGINPDPANEHVVKKAPKKAVHAVRRTTSSFLADKGVALDRAGADRVKAHEESMDAAGTNQIFDEGSAYAPSPAISDTNARNGTAGIARRAAEVRASRESSKKIKHVVVFMQENHTYDDYFGRLEGGNGDPNLFSVEDPAKYTFPWLPTHGMWSWKNRGWMAAHEQRDEYQVPLYWRWARDYALLDDHHAFTRGPSTANHIAHFAQWAHNLLGNPYSGAVGTIVDHFQGQPERPPFDMDSLPHHLEAAGRSWGNYGSGAFANVKDLKDSPNSLRAEQFEVDAKNGKLRDVSFVVPPNFGLNEHSPDAVRPGMEWMAQQVQAIVDGGHWEDTAILITWDDYGGYVDHAGQPLKQMWVHDPTRDYALGPRVPLLVLSPYAKAGYLTREDKDVQEGKERSFLSIPAFIGNVFGVDGVAWKDERPAWLAEEADNLLGVFDFEQKPLAAPDTTLPPEVKRTFLKRVAAAWKEAGQVEDLADLKAMSRQPRGFSEALHRRVVEGINEQARSAPAAPPSLVLG